MPLQPRLRRNARRLVGATLLGTAAAAAVASGASLEPRTLTFDGNVQSSFQFGVFEQGFRFANPESSTAVVDRWNAQGAHNGTPTLWVYRYPVTMDRRDVQPFVLEALDIGFYWVPSPPADTAVTAVLTLPGGGEERHSFLVSDSQFRRWSFGGVEVQMVRIEQPYDHTLRLDNIDVLAPAAVPEPAAAGMMALGVALLGLLGRRSARARLVARA